MTETSAPFGVVQEEEQENEEVKEDTIDKTKIISGVEDKTSSERKGTSAFETGDRSNRQKWQVGDGGNFTIERRECKKSWDLWYVWVC